MKIDEIKQRKHISRELSTLLPRYSAEATKSHCDKHACKFGGDSRFANFKATIFLDCHTGYYGNSSCSALSRIDDKVATDLLNRTLNLHMKLILDTMAAIALTDAANLVDDAQVELDDMQNILNLIKL